MSGAWAKVGAIESRCYLNVAFPKYPRPQPDQRNLRNGKYICAKAENIARGTVDPGVRSITSWRHLHPIQIWPLLSNRTQVYLCLNKIEHSLAACILLGWPQDSLARNAWRWTPPEHLFFRFAINPWPEYLKVNPSRTPEDMAQEFHSLLNEEF